MATSAPLLGEPLPIELMNTIWADTDGGHDELTDRAGLLDWLAAVADRAELADLHLANLRDPAALAAFRALREALRVLAAEATDDSRPIAAHPASAVRRAVAEVNRASALAPSWPELAWTAAGAQQRLRSAAKPWEVAMSRISGAGVQLFAGPDELRPCNAPGCVLYFVRDHPRREWCSASCGNRARVARHYARHHPR
jgi:predicted RNA-binding Zn ribbon-like protein